MANKLSIAQLERLLDKKKQLLTGLQKKRARLQQELAGVETRIAQIDPPPPAPEPAPRIRRKRPRNKRKLEDVIAGLLKNNKRGLLLSEIADKVLATGYIAGTVNFANTVYQCLRRGDDRFAYDPTTRLYRLK